MSSQSVRWAAWAEATAASWRAWDAESSATAAPTTTPAPSPADAARPAAAHHPADSARPPWATPTTARSLMDRLTAMGAVPALGGGVPLPSPACPRDTDRSGLASGLEAAREGAAVVAGARVQAGDRGRDEIRAVGALLRAASSSSSDGGEGADGGAAGGAPAAGRSAKAGAPGGGCVVVTALATAAPPDPASVAAMAEAFTRRAGLE